MKREIQLKESFPSEYLKLILGVGRTYIGIITENGVVIQFTSFIIIIELEELDHLIISEVEK